MHTLPPLPFWMAQRQVKSEPLNDHTLRLVGPNLPTCDVTVLPLPVGPGWRVVVARLEADGARTTLMQTETGFHSPEAAWQAAFELYRQRVIV